MNKPIFSRVIADLLVERGFKIIDERPNYRQPDKRVYFFEKTEELEKAFYEIVNGKTEEA